MAKVNCYLSFNGTCEEAFNFYKSVFGKEFNYVGRYSDMPSEQPIPESEKNKIMHIGLPISNETMLMGCDLSEAMQAPKIVVGNNIALTISPDSEEEAYKIFNALSQNGTITMPMEKTFWGSLFGMLVDKYGICWMVDYALPQQ